MRKEFFCQKNPAMDKLPPTEDALLQHVRRAVYQAGIWTTSTQTQQVIPSPHTFAWNKVFVVMGTSLDDNSRGFPVMPGID
ncbi:hypothetical protein JTB14_023980 [Gonioctena quinquepunctata]|nr:hypothetical protein JTB14_023980 [Gonioctena quinquepunctata]